MSEQTTDSEGFYDPALDPNASADTDGAVLTDQAPAEPQGPVETEPVPEPGAPAGEPVDAPSVEASGPASEGDQDPSTPGEQTQVPDSQPEATPAPDAEEKVTPERRPRGWLANDVRVLLDEFVTGTRTLEAGQFLTPHRVAKLVQEMDNLDKAPSSGAVAAVFKRWSKYGFATFNDKPFSFIDYTDKGRQVGLQGLIEERAATRKRTRAEAKAAADAEAKAAEAEAKASAEAQHPANGTEESAPSAPDDAADNQG